MANTLYVQPTKFENIRTNGVTWGVRVYDDNFSFYSNIWEDLEIPSDDLELIEKVWEDFGDVPEIREAFEFVESEKESIFVGNEEYPWEKISYMF